METNTAPQIEQDWDEEDRRIHCRGRDCDRFTLNSYEFLRHDSYGVPTGHYCDDCYENNYPYRKDRYEYWEYGERLEELD